MVGKLGLNALLTYIVGKRVCPEKRKQKAQTTFAVDVCNLQPLSKGFRRGLNEGSIFAAEKGHAGNDAAIEGH